MNKVDIIGKTILLSSLAIISNKLSAQEQDKPNFVIILADDLGYGDLSCHGGNTPTPNIDKLFSQGVEFGNFMTWAVCSPTRAGLLTGLNPLRTGQGPNTDGQLSTSVHTIGSILQKNGYKTGIFGKWHNGDSPRFYPGLPAVNDYGFDRWVGFYGGGIDYYTKVWPRVIDSPCWFHDRTPVDNEREYSPDLLTKYAIDFMDKINDKPFLAYIPYNTVHTPHHVKEADLKRVPKTILEAAGGKLRSWKEYYKLVNDIEFKQLNKAYVNLTGDSTIFSIKGKLSEAELKLLYSAMIINLDDNVGKILNYLDKKGLSKNTVVLFFSDNGAIKIGSNLPFKGGKHTMWEGGVHSPAVIRWPGGGITGPGTFQPMVGYLDVLPTFLEIAGTKQWKDLNFDGKSFWKELKGGKESVNRSYYWVWTNHDVIRTDEWKMFRYFDHVELYNIKSDIGENNNVAEANPAVVKKMTAYMEQWRDDTGVALAHLAPKQMLDLKPAPKNKIMEIIINNGNNDGQLKIPLVKKSFKSLPGDYLHFDVMIKKSTTANGFFLTLFKKNMGPFFDATRGVDQYNRLQTEEPVVKDGNGTWEHRIIGLGNDAPNGIGDFGIVVKSPGEYEVLIDNIEIKRADGNIITYWNGLDKSDILKDKEDLASCKYSVRIIDWVKK